MSTFRPLIASLVLVSLVGCRHTSSSEGHAPIPAANACTDGGTVVIEGARVFDGERDLGEVTLVLEDGRLVAIVPAGAPVEAPEDAQRVDYSGHFIIPGLISAHSHVGNSAGTEHGDRFYTREHVLRNLRQFQAYGVTTVTSLGLNGEAFFELREAVNANPTLGAQLYGAGAGVGVTD